MNPLKIHTSLKLVGFENIHRIQYIVKEFQCNYEKRKFYCVKTQLCLNWALKGFKDIRLFMVSGPAVGFILVALTNGRVRVAIFRIASI
jgi:hypothetical protein